MKRIEALNILSCQDDEDIIAETFQLKCFEQKQAIVNGAFSSPLISILIKRVNILVDVEHALKLPMRSNEQSELISIDFKGDVVATWNLIQKNVSILKTKIFSAQSARQLSLLLLDYKVLAVSYEKWILAILSELKLPLIEERVPAKEVLDAMRMQAVLQELFSQPAHSIKIDAKFEEDNADLLREYKRVKEINSKFLIA